jgi:hypothetical protein
MERHVAIVCQLLPCLVRMIGRTTEHERHHHDLGSEHPAIGCSQYQIELLKAEDHLRIDDTRECHNPDQQQAKRAEAVHLTEQGIVQDGVTATVCMMALAINWVSTGTLLTIRTGETFIAVAMCLLAVPKLQDVDAFATMFMG